MGLWPGQGVEDEPRRLAAAVATLADRPLWNDDLLELWWRGHRLKRYKSLSPAMRAMLNAFQRAAWEPCIENPALATFKGNYKKLMKQLVSSFNRYLDERLIRVASVERGLRIRWEPT